MTPPTPTLGTLLRHLIETLDGAVEDAYRASGLDYRPRYTPVVKALTALGPVSIRVISRQAGISHSAASQTVSQMVREGLVALSPGIDGRERIVALTPRAQAMLPAVTRQWRAVNAAAAGLDAELSAPLSGLLVEAIAALERKTFGDRIADAAEQISLEAP
ncbi:MarR family winged helix-turn-helix transcriptional regulator [Caulobacter soli]|uniref:MarR family winged helix-turn-helix transcriptional regulator n=1 Tax=Caulobacter soli TaxID=2708539 RepID=UPI0013EB68F9|nr:MarR family winged helix-turn-helix transcriptional regulator [Caulobacter soli]